MLWYFWSGQLSSKHLNCGVHHVSLNIKKPLAFKNVTDLKMSLYFKNLLLIMTTRKVDG